MPALVPELVNMASDPAVSTADLLRRALVVARRLAVPELVDWIKSELRGYGASEVPSYRKLKGTILPVPKRGEAGAISHLNPAALDDLFESASEVWIPYEISVVEQMAASKNELFVQKFSPKLDYFMQKKNIGNFTIARTTSRIQYCGILDCVKTTILEWALDLEERNIIGESMSFTPQEKQAVQEQHYHISNVSGSQIQIGSGGSTQIQANTTGTNIETLKELIEALRTVFAPIQGDAGGQLREELAALKAMAESPTPKWEIIKATVRSIKAVAEGAGGNILGELAKPHFLTLLALAGGA